MNGCIGSNILSFLMISTLVPTLLLHMLLIISFFTNPFRSFRLFYLNIWFHGITSEWVLLTLKSQTNFKSEHGCSAANIPFTLRGTFPRASKSCWHIYIFEHIRKQYATHLRKQGKKPKTNNKQLWELKALKRRSEEFWVWSHLPSSAGRYCI